MPDQNVPDPPLPEESKPAVIKGSPIAGQAEKLVRVRREINQLENLTRIEQIEKNAREKADALLGKARTEAGKILTDAKNEAQSIRDTARQEGDLAAKREALEKIAGLISSLENEIETLKNIRADFLRANLIGIIDLSCTLAQKILVCELRTRPEVVADRARALLERMPPGHSITLIASPDDIEIIQQYLVEAGGPSDAIIPSLRSDPEMTAGSLRLESDSGRIDAGVLDLLEELGNLLNEQARHYAEDDYPWWEGCHGD